MSFGQLIEDPFYDDDGVLIDEDAEWEDIEQLIDEGGLSYDPYDTVNS